MTYRGYKTLEMMLCVVLVSAFCIAQVLESPFAIAAVIASLGIACLIASAILRRRAYPQWKGYAWMMPWKYLIPELAILCTIAVLGEMNNIHFGNLDVVTLVIFAIVLINGGYDLYCTIKHDMDRFGSVQEFFAAYPKARMRFQRDLFTKDPEKS